MLLLFHLFVFVIKFLYCILYFLYNLLFYYYSIIIIKKISLGYGRLLLVIHPDDGGPPGPPHPTPLPTLPPFLVAIISINLCETSPQARRKKSFNKKNFIYFTNTIKKNLKLGYSRKKKFISITTYNNSNKGTQKML